MPATAAKDKKKGFGDRILGIWGKVRKEIAPKVHDWFFSNTWTAALAWVVIAAACILFLAWFFLVSGYGQPAAPIYEGF